MIRTRHILAALVLAALSASLVAGCAAAPGAPGTPGAPGGAASAPLDGTQWRLTGWTISSIDPAAVTITVKFAAGQISGNSGVNSYGGPYKSGPGNAFSVGELAQTLMAGPEPAMRAETAYMTLLAQAKSFKADGSKLTLFDAGGNESLIFEATAK